MKADRVVSTRQVRTALLKLLFADGSYMHTLVRRCTSSSLVDDWPHSPKGGENRAVIPLDLAIRLGVVCGSEGVVDSRHLTYTLEEIRGEALAVVRYEVLRWSVIENSGFDKTLSDFCSRLTLQGDCLYELSESVDDQ